MRSSRRRERKCFGRGEQKPNSFERDPKAEKYVDLAIQADATYLVIRDNDLLDLMERGTVEGEAFRRRFPSLTILDPVAFPNLVR